MPDVSRQPLPLPLRVLFAVAGAAPACVAAQGTDLEQQARRFAIDAVTVAGARVEVQVGALDPRLRLAPCARVEPYVPAGTKLWGRSRIGLRCTEGPTRWNVYLPLVVKVYGQALTAVAALPAGSVLAAADFRPAEVDLADGAAPLRAAEAALGRTLARPLAPGQALRATDLRPRQWFAAGDTVQITAVGAGFRITGEGQALGPGLEGRPARVRIEGGRIVVGEPVADRQVQVRL